MGHNVVIATLASEAQDKLLAELRGFSFFDAERIGDERRVSSLNAEHGSGPANLIAFPDGSGRFLVGCGVKELYLADQDLHLEPVALPSAKHLVFKRPAVVRDEIWFVLWSSGPEPGGIAIRSDGTHRLLE
jgi:hypothetical protein